MLGLWPGFRAQRSRRDTVGVGFTGEMPVLPGFCGLLHEVDLSAMPDRGGEAAVAGQQPSIERFRKRDVNSLVGRKVVPQLPDPRQATSRSTAGRRLSFPEWRETLPGARGRVRKR